MVGAMFSQPCEKKYYLLPSPVVRRQLNGQEASFSLSRVHFRFLNLRKFTDRSKVSEKLFFITRNDIKLATLITKKCASACT